MKNNLEFVKALIKEMNEELKGGQKKLDVAPPFGKLTGADFKKLRGAKNEAAPVDDPYGENPDLDIKADPEVPGMGMTEGLGNEIGDKVYFRGDIGQKFPSSQGYYGIIEDYTVARNYNMNAVYKVAVYDRNDKKVSIVRGDWSNFTDREINENHEGADHEVSMANNSIDSIIWAAGELKKHLQGGERDIPAWIQDHITNAENYILQAAKNYHEYGAEEPTEEPEAEYGDEEQDMSLTSLMEGKKKPSAGLTKKQKSAIAKKARKGGDVGKKGKGFAKVEKAAKKSGARNPKAVAAAAMWKAAAKRAKK